jgi:hypothetical protein
MDKEPVEIVEDIEEVVVEVVKAPFKIVGGLLDWITGDEI